MTGLYDPVYFSVKNWEKRRISVQWIISCLCNPMIYKCENFLLNVGLAYKRAI